jgi:hypothetical protein
MLDRSCIVSCFLPLPDVRDIQLGRLQERPHLWDVIGTDDEELEEMDPEPRIAEGQHEPEPQHDMEW